jgi:hypothetical protein
MVCLLLQDVQLVTEACEKIMSPQICPIATVQRGIANR